MKLFDDFERTELIPQETSNFQTYNLSSHPEITSQRTMCNEWFSRFPTAGQSDLRNGFCSDDNQAHRSAWFELLLHEILHRLGCSLAHHPTDSNTSRRPDYLVEGAEKDCYLEATVIFADAADRRVTPQEEKLLKLIDDLESPNFMLFPRSSGELYASADAGEILERVRGFLENHEPESVRRLADIGEPRPSVTLSLDGWTMELDLVPRDSPDPSGSTLPFTPFATASVDGTDDLITDKVIRKIVGKDADKLSRPLVVAAVMPTPNYCPKIDAIPRLLGPDAVVPGEGSGSDSTIVRRGAEGVGIGPNGSWRHNNCHAVWMFPDAWATSLSVPGEYQPWLFLNPLTDVNLPDELLRVSHVRIVNGERPEWVDGIDLKELLSG